MIWKQNIDIEGLMKFQQNTLVSHLGIVLTKMGEDYLEATMPVDDRTVQPMRLLHGGASVALAETLGSMAGMLCVENINDFSVVGVSINANHLKAVRSGLVTGRAKPIRIGRNIQVWKIKIHNEEEQLVCVSRLTLAVVPRSK